MGWLIRNASILLAALLALACVAVPTAYLLSRADDPIGAVLALDLPGFGEFASGFVSPLATALLILTVILQGRELRLTRDELKGTRKAGEQQASALRALAAATEAQTDLTRRQAADNAIDLCEANIAKIFENHLYADRPVPTGLPLPDGTRSGTTDAQSGHARWLWELRGAQCRDSSEPVPPRLLGWLAELGIFYAGIVEQEPQASDAKRFEIASRHNKIRLGLVLLLLRDAKAAEHRFDDLRARLSEPMVRDAIEATEREERVRGSSASGPS